MHDFEFFERRDARIVRCVEPDDAVDLRNEGFIRQHLTVASLLTKKPFNEFATAQTKRLQRITRDLRVRLLRRVILLGIAQVPATVIHNFDQA